ncbi:MAG: hypothetical protein KAV83_04085 [Desulfobacterales bacterium]|nr:hypothetical protein [Desulfobacterales bacterium]
MTEFVLNNTVLSNYSSVVELDIIRKVLNKVSITSQVLDEVMKAIEVGHTFQLRTLEIIEKGSWIEVVSLSPEMIIPYTQLANKAGRGEASSIAFCAGVKNRFFLSDDKRARSIATQKKIKVGGSLTILLRAVEGRILDMDEGNRILTDFIKNGYRSPIQNLREVLHPGEPKKK